MRSVRFIALFSLVFGWALTGLAPIPAQAAGPSVTITQNSVEIATLQSVGPTSNPDQNRFRSKSRDDFLAFGASVAPARLTGPPGLAEAFAQVAATIVGPTTTPIEGEPLE